MLGSSIKKLRKQKGFSQRYFANELKVGHTYLSQIENDKKVPSPKLLSEICELLTVNEFFLRFMNIQENDIKPEKREAFRKISPKLNELIEDFLI